MSGRKDDEEDESPRVPLSPRHHTTRRTSSGSSGKKKGKDKVKPAAAKKRKKKGKAKAEASAVAPVPRASPRRKPSPKPAPVESTKSESEELMMRAASEIRMRMSRDLTSEESRMILALDEWVSSIVEHPQGDETGWLGSFPYRVRNDIGNPSDEMVRALILPSAYETLLRINQRTMALRVRAAAAASRGAGVGDGGPPCCSPAEAIDAAVRLLVGERWSDARHLLNDALRSHPQDLRLYKMLALAVSNDRVLNWRYVRLLDTVRRFESIERPDAEIMAQLGDLHHRMWRMSKSETSTAERAVDCYMSSYRMAAEAGAGPPGLGYGLSKAAQLSIDLFGIARGTTRSAVEAVSTQRGRATKNLEDLVDALERYARDNPDADLRYKQYWYNLLYGNLGLGRYKEGRKAGARLAELLGGVRNTDDYLELRLRDFLTSLVRVVVFRGHGLPQDNRFDGWPDVWRTVRDSFPIVNVTYEVLHAAIRGRVGLSLSGGGMRASFLHLGLLARLAECDVLRQVSAISAVSGGSIVGTMYYLRVRELLESRPDSAVTREDYIALVRGLIDDFVAGTCRDPHFSTFLNPADNLRVAFASGTRRVHLLARQFDRLYFDQWVPRVHGTGPDGEARSPPLMMRKLRTRPKGWSPARRFNPRLHNWSRSAVVPALYLNAVNLNTGHVWRFTTSYMGEKADMSGAELGVDANQVLESVYYDEAYRREHRDIPVSHCVAVTALIPGLISAPYPLDGLYPGVKVRLADGSVFDNAGVESLYHAGADVLIVNNQAQTLTDANEHPPDSSLATILRVLEINLDLTFERIYNELALKAQTHGVRHVAFIHARQGQMLDAAERESLLLHRRIQPRKRVNTTKMSLSKDFHSLKATERERLRAGSRFREADVRMRVAAAAARNSVPEDCGDGDGDGDGGADVDVEMQQWAAPHMARESSVDDNGGRRSRASSDTSDTLMHDDFATPDLVELRRKAQRMIPLSFGDLLRSEFPEVRTSMDRFTEVEMCALMANGYMLTRDALKNLAERADSDRADMTVLMAGPDSAGGVGSASATLRASLGQDQIPAGRWALFDAVCESRGDWRFSRAVSLLEEADSVPVPPDFYPTAETGVILQDKDKLARAVRRNMTSCSELADNPALVSLYEQLEAASGQISFFRVLSVSRLFSAALVLVFLLLCGGLAYAAVDSFVNFLDNDGVTQRECLCLYEQPLIFLAMLLALFLLLVSPGYLSSFVWAVALAPALSALSVYVFDPFLARRGSMATLVELDDEHREREARRGGR